MPHGTNCHCIICTMGKKIGMIRHEHAQGKSNHDNNCDHCGPAEKTTENK